MYKNFRDIQKGDTIYLIYLDKDAKQFEIEAKEVTDIVFYDTITGYVCGYNEYYVNNSEKDTWYSDYTFDTEIVTDIECAKNIMRRRIGCLIDMELNKIDEANTQIRSLRSQMDRLEKL